MDLARFFPRREVYRWFVRSSLSLKLLLLFAFGSFLPFPFWFIIAATGLLYYILMIYRYRFGYRYLGSLSPLLVLPLVKLVMDVGLEWGRISYLIDLWRRR